jgi:uncharacterized protein
MKLTFSRHAFLIAAITFLQVVPLLASASDAKKSFKSSFDCTKARTRVEIAICGNKELADADSEMALLYKSLMTGISENEKDQLKHEQREWLKNRSLCGSSNVIIDCLKAVYDKRIGSLKGRKDALNKPVVDDKTSLSGNVDIPFTIKKGELRVFGHVLTSKEISAKEDEYFVSFRESPDKRWVVIGYDEPFEKTLVWLYDRTRKAAPVLVKAKRVGKHFGVDWYGDSVFAIFWAGMGYKTSQLFKVDMPDVYTQVESIIDYDPTRDIYARFAFDTDSIFVIVGRAFHAAGDNLNRANGNAQADMGEEKFSVKMDREDTDITMMPVDNVQFGTNDITITYTSEKGIVTERHKSKIAENAK